MKTYSTSFRKSDEKITSPSRGHAIALLFGYKRDCTRYLYRGKNSVAIIKELYPRTLLSRHTTLTKNPQGKNIPVYGYYLEDIKDENIIKDYGVKKIIPVLNQKIVESDLLLDLYNSAIAETGLCKLTPIQVLKIVANFPSYKGERYLVTKQSESNNYTEFYSWSNEDKNERVLGFGYTQTYISVDLFYPYRKIEVDTTYDTLFSASQF